jgi:hypothetical protein
MAGRPLAWANERSPARTGVPSLTEIALNTIAAHPDAIVSLSFIPEQLVVRLLYLIMSAGRLDYRLATVFCDSGNPDVAAAIQELDLVAAMPTHNALGSSRGWLG